MSLQNGLAAFSLEMSDYVPRTEYSASTHWGLVKRVTGIDADAYSTPEHQSKASSEFMKAWDYAFNWNVKLHSTVFGQFRASMGHASYASGGVDLNKQTFCAFADEDEVLSFDPFDSFGKIDIKEWTKTFEDDYKMYVDGCPDTVNMTGTYVTCISGLIELLGWDLLLCTAGVNPDGFGDLTNRYASWIMQFFYALAESNVSVIMVHDDIVWTEGPFLHPDWYRKYVFPHYKKFFDPLLQAGKKVIFTSDGNYTMFIDDVAKAGAQGFVLEPLTDLKYVAEKYGKTHIIVGNADTRALLLGTKEDIYSEVKRCMDTAKHCPGFIMAVGNHIPSNTPVDAALYYDEIYRKLSKR